MADRRFLTLRKTIMFYICIWNIFLLTGCAMTEMVSEDNTVTNENIASTTGNIEIETENHSRNFHPAADSFPPPECEAVYPLP